MPESERQRLSRIKPNLERRSLIYESTRGFFRDAGFLEVETPVRYPIVAPEQFITPIESEGWFLCTSPELHMKRLLASGYTRLFQFSRCFRKGERGRWHNPEFSMLEWYRTGADYIDVLHDTEMLVTAIANAVGSSNMLSYRGNNIDISLPWPRLTVRRAFLDFAGWDPFVALDCVRFDDDLVTKVIQAFPADRPVILMDYPPAMASLARIKPGKPDVAERAEVFIGGLEMANAYSELTDVNEQTRRFQAEIQEIQRKDGKTRQLPDKFLEALPHLPACGGIALGMDRLVMLFCDADSIDDVMPFTSERG